tara:strand:+ start:340 stop:789 length:450 start_codon:yes stop_codon:yes gene_type:complete
MKYLKRIYNNIKYILTNDLNFIKVNNVQLHVDNMTKLNELSKRIDDNYDKLDNKYYDLDNSIDDISRDIEDKMNYDDVVDCIFDNPDNDMKEDIKQLKVLCDVLTKNNDLLMQKDKLNDDSIDNLIERDLLINEVIKSIVNRLENNDNV